MRKLLSALIGLTSVAVTYQDGEDTKHFGAEAGSAAKGLFAEHKTAHDDLTTVQVYGEPSSNRIELLLNGAAVVLPVTYDVLEDAPPNLAAALTEINAQIAAQ